MFFNVHFSWFSGVLNTCTILSWYTLYLISSDALSPLFLLCLVCSPLFKHFSKFHYRSLVIFSLHGKIIGTEYITVYIITNLELTFSQDLFSKPISVWKDLYGDVLNKCKINLSRTHCMLYFKWVLLLVFSILVWATEILPLHKPWC